MEIKFRHFRTIGDIPEKGMPRHGDLVLNYHRGHSRWTPNEKGGITECYVYENGRMIGFGMAHCSFSDAFCYRIGRKIAKGRALADLERRGL